MQKTWIAWIALATLGLAAVPACGDDDDNSQDDGGTAETTDHTGGDADAQPDTGPDAEPDTGGDADAEPDTGPDAEPDTGPDAEPDTGPDAEPDTHVPAWDPFCRRAETCGLVSYDECAPFGTCIETVGRPEVVEAFFTCAAASCETLDVEHGPCASHLTEAEASAAAVEYAAACRSRSAELGCSDECWLPNWYNDATVAALRSCLGEADCDAIYTCRQTYDCD